MVQSTEGLGGSKAVLAWCPAHSRHSVKAGNSQAGLYIDSTERTKSPTLEDLLNKHVRSHAERNEREISSDLGFRQKRDLLFVLKYEGARTVPSRRTQAH